jgi:redox-sensitive bicupin YhaK (pirin superfamily)
MKVTRRSQDRGHADQGWLNSYHSFSFAEYFDEDHVEFTMRAPCSSRRARASVPRHRNMEIISYVLAVGSRQVPSAPTTGPET